MPDSESLQLESELRKYGVPAPCLRTFSGQASPDLVEYLDLVWERRPREFLPDGVAESQDKPLLYYVNASRLAGRADEQEDRRRLRRALGCRGQRAYLAVVGHGQLEVVPISLDEKTPKWKAYSAEQREAITFFSSLALGHYEGVGEPSHPDYAFQAMFNLLTQACGELAAPRYGLSKGDVLSLVGRALFWRFLVDREIVKEDDVETIAPGAEKPDACFDTAERAAATCRWLDETFNGDFLPLTDNGSLAFFDRAGQQSKGKVFHHLHAIAHRYEAAGGGAYQTLLWSAFDFAHVPVGLLSQVYEAFCWKWEPQAARTTSVHYTPRNIAATLVDEVFDKLPKAHECRVLDPACGGGVFLVLAFRRLYRERWKATGQPPDTKAIRQIMERQLTGFDISESAIRLAALSLYLTAIELDPEPNPPGKLKFAKLRKKVLFNWRQDGEPAHGPVIGSLGEHVGRGFDGQFDIVLSNPPWTSLPKKDKGLAAELEAAGWEKDSEDAEGYLKNLAERYTALSQAVIERKGEQQLAQKYQNPDKVPDLPILWRSTEWCKPDHGRIAMALPARFLLKQEDVPTRAREAFLQLVEVTGIINGSNLADTPVWPKMGQPFVLLFARNRRPQAGHAIKFISPHFETVLNRKGEVRIDSKSAQPVEIEATVQEPWLWKALAVGTALDIAVVRKLSEAGTRPLLEYWEGDLHLVSSNGYQIKEQQKKRANARFLKGLPDLNSTELFRFVVDPDMLPQFNRKDLFRTREGKPDKLAVYRAPLALVKESPGGHRQEGRALLGFVDIAYDDSFNAYSGAHHPDGGFLVRYLHLLVHSQIWMHYALLTSPKFGAERRRIYKSDLDVCPIIPLQRLTESQKQTILELSNRLVLQETGVFDQIDAFFAGIYGLDNLDVGVIRDTLEVGLPYRESRRRACQRPNAEEQDSFRHGLEGLLQPFFAVVDEELAVRLWKPPDARYREAMPFGVLLLGRPGEELPEPDEFFREKVLGLANETGQTLIFQHSDRSLLVAILNQYRYWTPSRARLLAADILRNHMAPFEE